MSLDAEVWNDVKMQHTEACQIDAAGSCMDDHKNSEYYHSLSSTTSRVLLHSATLGWAITYSK